MTDLAIWIDDERILRPPRWLRTFGWRGRGVAQGRRSRPCSPTSICIRSTPDGDQGHRMIRYADDFVILAASAREAQRALKDVRAAAARRGLALNRDKTRIRAAGRELRFLGCSICATRTPRADLARLGATLSPSLRARA